MMTRRKGCYKFWDFMLTFMHSLYLQLLWYNLLQIPPTCNAVLLQQCRNTSQKRSLEAWLSLNSHDLLHGQVCELALGDESTTTLRKGQGAHTRMWTLKDPDLSASP